MTDELLIDTSEQDKRKKMGLAAAGLLLALGLFLVLTYRDYLDIGHLPISLIYLVGLLITYQALRKAKIVKALLGIVLVTSLLVAAIAKVRWNQNYLADLATPHAFLFEDYIDQYPRLEEYIFSGTLDQQDWVRFANECGQPALHGRAVGPNCRTAAAIYDRYRINITEEMNDFLVRMQKTAKDIQEGRIKSGTDYLKCISSKRCAPIPLLPEEAKAEEVEKDASKYTDIRRAFWDLVEGKGLTYGICTTMVLCKAMAATGAVTMSAGVEQQSQDSPLE